MIKLMKYFNLNNQTRVFPLKENLQESTFPTQLKNITF